LVENKKVVMVGIPGVGKTTLLTNMEKIIKNHKKSVCVISFGTLMFELAKENGIKDRDELRKLSVSEQQKLQKLAAEKIALHDEDVVIIDTHAFISSSEGYYPGLPEHVLKIIKPTNFVSVSAKPEEIYNRRMKDDTRNRDKITLANMRIRSTSNPTKLPLSSRNSNGSNGKSDATTISPRAIMVSSVLVLPSSSMVRFSMTWS